MNRRYQNSVCKNNYLHDYRQTRIFSNGVEERCTRCKHAIFFPYNVPNHVYLSHHIRSAIQPSDPLYYREYPEQIYG